MTLHAGRDGGYQAADASRLTLRRPPALPLASSGQSFPYLLPKGYGLVKGS